MNMHIEENTEKAKDVLRRYLQLSKTEQKPFDLFDKEELKDAIEFIFGYSVVHFIKGDDRTISWTDLQTDLKFLVETIKTL
jgi:hypothetical protein